MISLLVVCALCGAVVGVLAGLLGVGGGVVIVPMLNMVFAWQGYDPAIIQHLSLGTSLAAIVFTSVSSFRAHNAHGAVHWDIWRAITPGIVVGTLGGALIAGDLSTTFLKTFFVIFLFAVGTQMLLNFKPKPSRHIPGLAGTSAVGLGIGIVSSFAGIGGGSLSVPFMTLCNVDVKHAVGTSAAIGLPIAFAGAAGYAISGWHDPLLPVMSLGYISLPALAGIVIPSMLTAPLGASIAHAVPADKLKRFFGIFIWIMACRMAYGLL